MTRQSGSEMGPVEPTDDDCRAAARADLLSGLPSLTDAESDGPDNPRQYGVTVSTFMGPGGSSIAVHFYVSIWELPPLETHHVTRDLGADEVREMNRCDRIRENVGTLKLPPLRVGDSTERFESLEAALKAGVDHARARWPGQELSIAHPWMSGGLFLGPDDELTAEHVEWMRRELGLTDEEEENRCHARG